MYYKEEIEITNNDRIIIEKLCELLAQSKIDDYFYVHDLEFFVQMGLFTNSEFEEAYDKGFCKYFSDKHYYRWVRNNVIYKFTALLEALFKGLLQQFENADEDGVLTYKNCRAYRTYHIATQSIEQAETTHDVSSRILTLEEAKRYETDELELEDNVVQVLECFHIKVESSDKVDSKKKKELIEQLRVLIYQRMCALLEANFKRANCVEIIQYRLLLAVLTGTIDKSFEPRFKKENNYERFNVSRDVSVELRSEFDYFKARYLDLVHYKKSLIKMEF